MLSKAVNQRGKRVKIHTASLARLSCTAFFAHLSCQGWTGCQRFLTVPGRAFAWSIQQRFWAAPDRRQLRAAWLSVAVIPSYFMSKVGMIPLRNTAQTSLLGSSLTCNASPKPVTTASITAERGTSIKSFYFRIVLMDFMYLQLLTNKCPVPANSVCAHSKPMRSSPGFVQIQEQPFSCLRSKFPACSPVSPCGNPPLCKREWLCEGGRGSAGKPGSGDEMANLWWHTGKEMQPLCS